MPTLPSSPLELAVLLIGLSHLLQPPVTYWLAKRVLGLAPAFAALPPLPGRIVRIMALTAIGLPTSLGVLVGLYAPEVLAGGMPFACAVLLSGGLWLPRMAAQILLVGPLFPREHRIWNAVLLTVFAVQGPILLSLLVVGRWFS